MHNSVCLQVAGEVLSVDTKSAVEIAEKNASLNGITNCRYFAGKGEDVIPVLVKEQKYDEVCAVVMFSKNRSYKSKFSFSFLHQIMQCCALQ
jgi:23S rRNA G2069 N7-methylase RlmK/C1962 C5-methylase RlmI